MHKVGLTGGIGSGKSLVASVFQALGIPVYFSDFNAKKIMQTNLYVKNEIIQLLGKESYNNEYLNNKFIASLVFSDNELLIKLNKIVHPAVKIDFLNWVENQKSKFVIQEAAILFESKANEYMDYSIAVYAPEEIRIKRVENRDGLSKDDILKRINQQMSDSELLKRSDYIINNYNDNLIIPQILEVYKSLCKK